MASDTSDNAVRVENLCKSYHDGAATRDILKNVSFTVEAGRSVAIMGPSGSGKTTLLNIAGTLDTATSGRVLIFGSDPFTLAPRELALFRNRSVGFVFQLHHLLPQCSLLENVLLPTIVAKETGGGESLEKRAARLLERAGLSARMHARPAQCSGGECQRAALVRALINRPKVLLADEPTGSLDRHAAGEIGDLLVELKREENTALIVVTHSAELAARMEQTLQLRDGMLAGG